MLTAILDRLKTPGGKKLLKGVGLVAVFAAGSYFGPAGAVALQKGIDLLAVPALQMLGVM